MLKTKKINLNFVGIFALAITTTQIAQADQFRFISFKGGKCLEVAEKSKQDGAKLKVGECNSESNNQVFEVDQVEGGLLQIRPAYSNLCLDVTDGSYDNGVPIQQWTCNDRQHQRFSTIKTAPESNWVELKAAHSNKCFDLTDGDFQAKSSHIQQWDCTDTNTNQYWVMIPVGTPKDSR